MAGAVSRQELRPFYDLVVHCEVRAIASRIATGVAYLFSMVIQAISECYYQLKDKIIGNSGEDQFVELILKIPLGEREEFVNQLFPIIFPKMGDPLREAFIQKAAEEDENILRRSIRSCVTRRMRDSHCIQIIEIMTSQGQEKRSKAIKDLEQILKKTDSNSIKDILKLVTDVRVIEPVKILTYKGSSLQETLDILSFFKEQNEQTLLLLCWAVKTFIGPQVTFKTGDVFETLKRQNLQALHEFAEKHFTDNMSGSDKREILCRYNKIGKENIEKVFRLIDGHIKPNENLSKMDIFRQLEGLEKDIDRQLELARGYFTDDMSGLDKITMLYVAKNTPEKEIEEIKKAVDFLGELFPNEVPIEDRCHFIKKIIKYKESNTFTEEAKKALRWIKDHLILDFKYSLIIRFGVPKASDVLMALLSTKDPLKWPAIICMEKLIEHRLRIRRNFYDDDKSSTLICLFKFCENSTLTEEQKKKTLEELVSNLRDNAFLYAPFLPDIKKTIKEFIQGYSV